MMNKSIARREKLVWKSCWFLVKGGTYYAIGSARIPCDDQTTSTEGDPHLQNIQGEFFDVWKLGTVDLLRFPQDRA